MKLPAESSSSWTLLHFAAFACSSLKAWSEFPELPQPDRTALAALATSLRAATDSLLKEARETQDVTIFGRPEAQARQNAWLTLLKRITSESLTMVAMRLGQGSKDSSPAREFLPNLLATLTAKPIADRPGIAAQAAKRLGALAGDFAEKATLASRLEATAKGAEAAVEANGEAFNAWDKERSEEVVAKGRLRLELERTHRALGAHFVGQKDFVESFFLKGERP
ncbi:MAG: hypothetical protein ACMG6S_13140, partial [Byssovorax sp.]